MPRVRTVSSQGPTKKQMLDFAIEDATRTIMQSDPVVKRREREIRKEVAAGIREADRKVKAKSTGRKGTGRKRV